MEIKNVKVSTNQEYVESPNEEDCPNYGGTYKDLLILKIPLPGGEAIYKLDLPKGVKENLEYATKLAEKT